MILAFALRKSNAEGMSAVFDQQHRKRHTVDEIKIHSNKLFLGAKGGDRVFDGPCDYALLIMTSGFIQETTNIICQIDTILTDIVHT